MNYESHPKTRRFKTSLSQYLPMLDPDPQQALESRLSTLKPKSPKQKKTDTKSKSHRADTVRRPKFASSVQSVLHMEKVIRRRKPRKRPDQSRYTPLLELEKQVQLKQTTKKLMRPGLGIFAVDDSITLLGKRLKSLNMTNTDTNRRRYHEMLFADEEGPTDMDQCFSGVLMREESMFQSAYSGKKLVNMIRERKLELGIRFEDTVEKIAGSFGEYITTGLDKLEETARRVKEKGVTFGLWRCVYVISDTTPSRLALNDNSENMARFASICQRTGLVPIMALDRLDHSDLDHDDASQVMRDVLSTLMKALKDHQIYMSGAILRVTAASPGPNYKGPEDLTRVAFDTAKTLNQSLPPAIGGVLLAREEDLLTSVIIMSQLHQSRCRKTFHVNFCYSRIIQEGVDVMWGGHNKNLFKARMELKRRAKLCSQAAMGQMVSRKRTSFFVKVEFDY